MSERSERIVDTTLAADLHEEAASRLRRPRV
jgi:hypothetical protein